MLNEDIEEKPIISQPVLEAPSHPLNFGCRCSLGVFRLVDSIA